MTLLAIDPSKTNLGWALFIDGTLAHTDTVSFTQCETPHQLFKTFQNWLVQNLHDKRVDMIAYETSQPRNMAHAEMHYGMIALMHLHAPPEGVHGINWSTAKKTLAGTGKASKDDMLHAAWEQYPTIGLTSADEADAVAVGLTMLNSLD